MSTHSNQKPKPNEEERISKLCAIAYALVLHTTSPGRAQKFTHMKKVDKLLFVQQTLRDNGFQTELPPEDKLTL